MAKKFKNRLLEFQTKYEVGEWEMFDLLIKMVDDEVYKKIMKYRATNGNQFEKALRCLDTLYGKMSKEVGALSARFRKIGRIGKSDVEKMNDLLMVIDGINLDR